MRGPDANPPTGTDPKQKRFCSAKGRRTGKPCGNRPMKGSTVCRMHGGKAPQVAKAAQNRVLVMSVIEKAERMIARAGVESTPEEILWDSLCSANAKRIIWGQEVAALDAKGKLYERSYITGTKTVHPAVDEEKHWIRECRQMAKDCITLGLKEREVRLAERQGEMIVQLFRAFMSDPDWPAEVRKEIAAKGPSIAARHLRALGSAA